MGRTRPARDVCGLRQPTAGVQRSPTSASPDPLPRAGGDIDCKFVKRRRPIDKAEREGDDDFGKARAHEVEAGRTRQKRTLHRLNTPGKTKRALTTSATQRPQRPLLAKNSTR